MNKNKLNMHFLFEPNYLLNVSKYIIPWLSLWLTNESEECLYKGQQSTWSQETEVSPVVRPRTQTHHTKEEPEGEITCLT